MKRFNKYLYHATYAPYLQSIMKYGLDPSIGQKNWDDSEHVIYLAISPDIAFSYAEASDIVPEKYLDQIVILVIEKTKLDNSKLIKDSNVQDCDKTFEYHGVIKPSLILEILF